MKSAFDECLCLIVQALCCTLNIQVIEDFSEKTKDKFRVSASLLILFTPALIDRFFSSTPLWMHTTFQPIQC